MHKIMGRKAAIACAAALAASLSTLAIPAFSAAAATPKDNGLHVNFAVSGTTTVKKTGSVVRLGPAVLKTVLEQDGSFTGSLALPPTTVSFPVAGVGVVSGTLTFIQSGAVTGVLKSAATTTVTSHTAFFLKLSNVTVGGAPAGVGSKCQTSKAVSLTVATPAGQSFNVGTGGKLTGSYTIGAFANCGAATPVINGYVAGPGNTISLRLTNGSAGS